MTEHVTAVPTRSDGGALDRLAIGRRFALHRLKLTKLVTALGSPQGRAAAREGLFPAIDHRALEALTVDFVLDVGANVGQFSLLCRELWPEAGILAFEPVPEAAAVFERHVAGPTTRIETLAIGPQRRRQTLHLSARADSSSLLDIGPGQTALFPGTGKAGEIEVEVRTLDQVADPDALPPNTLLKIDVQGTEADVLRSGPRTLSTVRWVYLELSFVELYASQPPAAEAIELLVDGGFALIGIHNPDLDRRNRVVQADFLFERSAPSVDLSVGQRRVEASLDPAKPLRVP